MTAIAIDPTERAPSPARHSASRRWCVITGEYPPLTGGVSDHTHQLVAALAADGDTVDVWCPPAPEDAEPAPEIAGVTVHMLPSRFGLGAIALLRRTLRALPPETHVLVQWVPTAFGWRMMNLPFALMLFALRGRRIDLYVHEVGWEVWRETARRGFAGIVHHVMTWLAARSARRVYVTIPAWGGHLRLFGAHALPKDENAVWIPVSSNVPDHADLARAAELRRGLLAAPRQRVVIGHFGTFGGYHLGLMPHVVARLLDEGADRTMLLVGRGGGALRDFVVAARPELASRIVATGGISPEEVAAHLAACDVLVQPYEDGASTRRSSLMAGVALGRPTITNRGRYTEELWTEQRAVHLTDSPAPHALAGAATKLLADPALRDRLSENSHRLHAERFAVSHAVAVLRGEGAGVGAPT